MLWSDPDDKPPEDMRTMQAMIHRAGLIMAVAAVIFMIVTGLDFR
ncbi:morphogenic membrane protein MmpB [Streptomyces sp. MUM 203J]|nr:hypothetical protein [Streptomyces sp. MUM 203J]